MDQDAFRQTYQQVNERYCAYEKAILTHQCNCSQARKLNIAEREATHCANDNAQVLCIQYLDALKKQARFALKLTTSTGVLPHGKAIKIQVGGLRGLQQVLHSELEPTAPIKDVSALIADAISTYAEIENLPFSRIMQQVAAYQGRKRVSKR